MKIEFVKNIQFSKLVKVDGQLREFNFRKVASKNEEKFTVDYNDERNRRIVFSMSKENGKWTFMNSGELTDAIAKNEEIFHEVIEQELKNEGN